MSLRDRRKYGITFFKVLRAARTLGNDPEFIVESNQEFAEAIIAEICGPQFRSDVDVDWPSIIEWIIKWLPMILKILALF